jgi:NAD(P)-dependent dehydrogenase (short-subunit alcohol dehydrogenase family)
MSTFDRFQLTGKRLVITGGSRGLGREMALAIAGADEILVGRDPPSLEETRRDGAAMSAIRVQNLVSPPRTHRYNDAIKANIGSRQSRTVDDAGFVLQETNAIARPWRAGRANNTGSRCGRWPAAKVLTGENDDARSVVCGSE